MKPFLLVYNRIIFCRRDVACLVFKLDIDFLGSFAGGTTIGGTGHIPVVVSGAVGSPGGPLGRTVREPHILYSRIIIRGTKIEGDISIGGGVGTVVNLNPASGSSSVVDN